jgi:hypothetical protein
MLIKLFLTLIYFTCLNFTFASLNEEIVNTDNMSHISNKMYVEDELLDILIKLLQRIKKTTY